jgi:cardiolipin synthase (CMP-forming)
MVGCGLVREGTLTGVYAAPNMPETPAPSDAIITIPNLLTFFRLGLTPLFLWAALGLDNMGLAVGITFLGVATDLIDGRIARRFGLVSKLGIALDPLADRLGIAAAALVLLVQDLAPWWAVVAVIGRDAALVLIGVPILKARGIPIPAVSRVGKWGSFLTSMAFAAFLSSGITSITDPNDLLRGAAFVLFIVGIPLYWMAGAGYIRAGLTGLRDSGGG